MGMFDYVICEYPLPCDVPKEVSKHQFQTKDLECELDRITIDKDGKMWRSLCAYDGKGSYDSPILMNYHGSLIFYTFLDDINSEYNWWEFEANFNMGRLLNITLCKKEQK